MEVTLRLVRYLANRYAVFWCVVFALVLVIWREHWIVTTWCYVLLTALFLSIEQAISSEGERRAEDNAPDRTSARQWVALEFLVTGIVGAVARLLFFLGGLLVAASIARLIPREYADLARYWPLLLLGGAVSLLCINVWQKFARRELRALI